LTIVVIRENAEELAALDALAMGRPVGGNFDSMISAGAIEYAAVGVAFPDLWLCAETFCRVLAAAFLEVPHSIPQVTSI